MNIESLLEYQKLDEELYKIEQKIQNSPYRKKANELAGVAKKTQVRSTELEAEANKLISEISGIKEKFSTNKAKAEEVQKTDLATVSMEEIDKLNNLKGKVVANLGILEKMLQKSAENVNLILSEFNKTKKTYDEARQQYEVCKQKMVAESKQLEPEKEKIIKQLAVMEKNVEPTLMAEYKKKRQDNIFPVVVPLEGGNFCGRCRMELPKVAISRIKEKGVITCEHCKRFIYQKV